VVRRPGARGWACAGYRGPLLPGRASLPRPSSGTWPGRCGCGPLRSSAGPCEAAATGATRLRRRRRRRRQRSRWPWRRRLSSGLVDAGCSGRIRPDLGGVRGAAVGAVGPHGPRAARRPRDGRPCSPSPPRDDDDDDHDDQDHDHDVGDEKIKVALEWASNPLMLHAPGAIEVWRLRRRPATARP